MGKLSKYRRTQLRKHREKIAELNMYCAAANNRAKGAEAQLSRIARTLGDLAASNVCLPVELSVGYSREGGRVPVRSRGRVADLCSEVARFPSAVSPAFEEIMFILQTDEVLQDRMMRCMHFRVVNPPGKQLFTLGYAVTHTALHHMREREFFVRDIAERMAGGIWKSLYGEAVPNERG